MSVFKSILTSLFGQSTNNTGSGLADMGQQLINQAANKLEETLDESVNSAKVNLENANKRLKPINEAYYPEFLRDKENYLDKTAVLWFARKDFEAARCYFSGGKEGYIVSERVMGNGPAQVTPPFLLLKANLEATEIKVKEMEAAKGFEFVSCIDNNIIFREISSGRVLSPEESSNI